MLFARYQDLPVGAAKVLRKVKGNVELILGGYFSGQKYSPTLIMTPDMSAETCDGAAACACGSQT